MNERRLLYRPMYMLSSFLRNFQSFGKSGETICTSKRGIGKSDNFEVNIRSESLERIFCPPFRGTYCVPRLSEQIGSAAIQPGAYVCTRECHIIDIVSTLCDLHSIRYICVCSYISCINSFCLHCRVGYEMLRGLGHSLVSPLPSLFSFKIPVSLYSP